MFSPNVTVISGIYLLMDEMFKKKNNIRKLLRSIHMLHVHQLAHIWCMPSHLDLLDFCYVVHYWNNWNFIDKAVLQDSLTISSHFCVLCLLLEHRKRWHHAFFPYRMCNLYGFSCWRLYIPLYMPLYCSHIVMHPNNCWQVWAVILFCSCSFEHLPCLI